jgi:DNA-binding NtrC family response regulator
MPNILVIEASPRIRATLRERLEYERHAVQAVESLAGGLELAGAFVPDVVLCDHCPAVSIELPFIVISDDPSPHLALAAGRAGAADFIPKPVDMNRLFEAIRRVVSETAGEAPDAPGTASVRATEAEPVRLRRPTARMGGAEAEMVGSSAPITRVRSLVDRVAPSDARVLILGDNGTGKELVARMLHRQSRRSAGPFVEINCAAIPSELIESELFGHEKGSFTSAIKMRRGKFEQAQGGTLFMDEIGDMSLSAQAKVLRALQEGRISRVGSDRDMAVDVRVVAANNKNLREEIDRGRFREDLYHRLSVIVIRVPRLTERADDIPCLVDYFLESVCREYGIPRRSICPEGVDALRAMPWRGNVRELRNVVERLVILGEEPISTADVHDYVSEFA